MNCSFIILGNIVINSLFVLFILQLTLERHKVKKVTRRHKRGEGGGGQSDPSPLLLTPFIRLTRYLAHIMSVLSISFFQFRSFNFLYFVFLRCTFN